MSITQEDYEQFISAMEEWAEHVRQQLQPFTMALTAWWNTLPQDFREQFDDEEGE